MSARERRHLKLVKDATVAAQLHGRRTSVIRPDANGGTPKHGLARFRKPPPQRETPRPAGKPDRGAKQLGESTSILAQSPLQIRQRIQAIVKDPKVPFEQKRSQIQGLQALLVALEEVSR